MQAVHQCAPCSMSQIHQQGTCSIKDLRKITAWLWNSAHFFWQIHFHKFSQNNIFFNVFMPENSVDTLINPPIVLFHNPHTLSKWDLNTNPKLPTNPTYTYILYRHLHTNSMTRILLRVIYRSLYTYLYIGNSFSNVVLCVGSFWYCCLTGTLQSFVRIIDFLIKRHFRNQKNKHITGLG